MLATLVIEFIPASFAVKINGSNTGNDKIGKTEFFEFAFATIAEIIVDDEAIPIDPRKILIKRKLCDFMTI